MILHSRSTSVAAGLVGLHMKKIELLAVAGGLEP